MPDEKIEYIYKFRPLYTDWKESVDSKTGEVIAKIKLSNPILNKNTENLLTKGELYFSIPGEFNDPFDCQFPINLDKYDCKNQYETKKNMTDIFNICCFSSIYNNMLMWSHYADSHKGICIGIETVYEKSSNIVKFEKFNNMDGIIAQKIIYQNPKIPKTDFLNLKKEKQLDIISKMILTKSMDWKYENEYRTILVNNMVNTQILILKKEYMRQIYFGIKTTDSEIVETLKIIKESNFINISKLEVYQMQDDEINYSLTPCIVDFNWEKLIINRRIKPKQI